MTWTGLPKENCASTFYRSFLAGGCGAWATFGVGMIRTLMFGFAMVGAGACGSIGSGLEPTITFTGGECGPQVSPWDAIAGPPLSPNGNPASRKALRTLSTAAVVDSPGVAFGRTQIPVAAPSGAFAFNSTFHPAVRNADRNCAANRCDSASLCTYSSLTVATWLARSFSNSGNWSGDSARQATAALSLSYCSLVSAVSFSSAAARSFACAVAVTWAASSRRSATSRLLPVTAITQAQITPRASAKTPNHVKRSYSPSTLISFFRSIAIVSVGLALLACLATLVILPRIWRRQDASK
jgi:hypothetical protein